MNYLIIRTFEKDDWLASLCINSWKKSGFNGEILIWSEDYKTKYLNDYKIIKRDNVDNFMGQIGVKSIIKSLHHIDVKDDDKVIMCDADIVIKKNPLRGKYDIKGVGAIHAGYFHFNGECVIISGKFCNYVKSLNEKDIDVIIWNEMIDKLNSVISDGHFFSYIAYRDKLEKKYCKNNWVHNKFYEYNDRLDYDEIIEKIKIDYPNER